MGELGQLCPKLAVDSGRVADRILLDDAPVQSDISSVWWSSSIVYLVDVCHSGNMLCALAVTICSETPTAFDGQGQDVWMRACWDTMSVFLPGCKLASSRDLGEIHKTLQSSPRTSDVKTDQLVTIRAIPTAKPGRVKNLPGYGSISCTSSWAFLGEPDINYNPSTWTTVSRPGGPQASHPGTGASNLYSTINTDAVFTVSNVMMDFLYSCSWWQFIFQKSRTNSDVITPSRSPHIHIPT